MRKKQAPSVKPAAMVSDQAGGFNQGSGQHIADKNKQKFSPVAKATTATPVTVGLSEEYQAQTLSFLEQGMMQMFLKILTCMRPVLEQLKTGITGSLLQPP